MSSRVRRSLHAKIDWDTVELVGALVPLPDMPSSDVPAPDVARLSQVQSVVARDLTRRRRLPDRRGRSVLKKLLSGASARARSRGAIYTHVQLRQFLSGLARFGYGWGLVAAAMECSIDFARGVETAAWVIEETARKLARVA